MIPCTVFYYIFMERERTRGNILYGGYNQCIVYMVQIVKLAIDMFNTLTGALAECRSMFQLSHFKTLCARGKVRLYTLQLARAPNVNTRNNLCVHDT